MDEMRKTRVIGIYLIFISGVFSVVGLLLSFIGHLVAGYSGMGMQPESVEQPIFNNTNFRLMILTSAVFVAAIAFAIWGVLRLIFPLEAVGSSSKRKQNPGAK